MYHLPCNGNQLEEASNCHLTLAGSNFSHFNTCSFCPHLCLPCSTCLFVQHWTFIHPFSQLQVTQQTLRDFFFSQRLQHRPGSTGLRSDIIIPRKGILPWEGAWWTQWSSKSQQLWTCTTQNLWESRVITPPPPSTHPLTPTPIHMSSEDWGQPAERP